MKGPVLGYVLAGLQKTQTLSNLPWEILKVKHACAMYSCTRFWAAYCNSAESKRLSNIKGKTDTQLPLN